MRLGAQAAAIGATARLALTATAAPPVRQEIIRRLGLRDPVVVIGDFDRPHIGLSVRHVRTVSDKERELVARGEESTARDRLRGDARQRAGRARHPRGVRRAGGALHAGLSARERSDAMAAFLDGTARVIAATVAFGMGIDKPDVRWVLHFDPTPSLDEYYQEFGRACRDARAAQARLLYRYEDFEMARWLTARGISTEAVARARG